MRTLVVLIALAAFPWTSPGQQVGRTDRPVGGEVRVPGIRPTQVAVVYDTEQKVLGVYHIDAEGAITLKGIRPIKWDLQLDHYNGKAPLPEDVKNGLTR